MLKCPFCHFDNEDGALFCEQCKSDLAGVASAPAPVAQAMPVEAMPAAEALPAEPYEAIPMAAEPYAAEPYAAEAYAAEPYAAEALPMEAMVAEAYPVEAQPLEEAPVAEAQPEPPPMPIAEAQPVPPPVPTPMADPMPAQTPPPAAHMAPPVLAAPVAVAAPAAPVAPAAPAAAVGLPDGAQPRLLVVRGQKRNVEYPIYEGLNFIGRADEKPVDIDLEDQEPPERIWCSRQHACLNFENNELSVEDLNSANGTYVNRARIYPGQKRQLVPNDVIQIGNVQMKVVV